MTPRHPNLSVAETDLDNSDQGSQFTSDDWQSFLKAHHMVPSMSRRGNCHDNAVAESFVSALKKERIKRHIYPSPGNGHLGRIRLH
ncbi:transposase InsO family protein [Paraburkholderia sp. JPY681]|nr:transposase InsO family protein [Paraburkholderia atlantica]